MLLLIGLGIDTKEISVKALEALRNADSIFLEQYTTFISAEYIKYLRSVSGKEVMALGRPELEEGAQETLKGAKSKTVAILVPGDPLIATTHYSTILNTARRLGIESKVYHSSSIYSAAVGESGLDVYRFGPPATIAFWSEKYKPTSVLDAIRKNMMNGQHSLVLLDLEQRERRPMALGEAITLLKEAEKEKGYGIINDDLKLIIMGDVGKETQEIAYKSLKEVPKISERFSKRMLVLVIPSSPSFAEQESLSGLEK
jgi:diphthine synthase